MKYKLVSLLSGLLLSTTIITPIIITSCSSDSSHDSVVEGIVEINSKYEKKIQNYLIQKPTKNFQLPKINNQNDIEENIKKIYEICVEAINYFNQFKQENIENLNEDQLIWIDSYITQWEIKKNNLDYKIIYLGANPIIGSRALSSSSNNINSCIKEAINIYPINPETGDPDHNKDPIESLILSLPTKIDGAIEYIQTLQIFLDKAIELGIMPSNVVKKAFIRQMMNFYYQNEMTIKVQSSSKLTVAKIIADNQANNYFSHFYNEIKEKTGKKYPNVEVKLSELSNILDAFVTFYSSKYWNNDRSFGYPEGKTNNPNLFVKISNDIENYQEVEGTITIGESNYYGLGYSQSELDQKNIGIGFMNINQVSKISDSNHKIDGNQIYDQLLYNNNSIKDNAVKIYEQGINATDSGIIKMKKIAKLVVNEILAKDYSENTSTSTFAQTKIYYDENIGDNKYPIWETLSNINNSNDDFIRFNIWLNQEDFFFGREAFMTQENNSERNVSKFIDKYWNNINQDSTLWQYKKIIIDQGYLSGWGENNSNINGGTHTVGSKLALAGAVASLESYKNFQADTLNSYNKNFKEYPDYVLSPYNFSIREDIGVGMEGPRGSNQFQYNCDPYYSLPKWSVASLTTHEGAIGHHTQQAYWTKYMPGKEGDGVNTPGYNFINDSFHEGWAVFSEWYATAIGTYGVSDNSNYVGNDIPTNWLKTNKTDGSLRNVENITQNDREVINAAKSLDGGTYWFIASQNPNVQNDEVLTTKLTVKLYNMLSYYGYLNESQLRNMRMCLDPAIHHQKQKTNNVENQNLVFGSSITDIRNYMTSNSSLSQGDIKSESIRYAVMPSQATGYMLGKNIFDNLYNAFIIKHNVISNGEINYNKIQEFFDLALRNGEIPLDVLVRAIENKFGFKKT